MSFNFPSSPPVGTVFPSSPVAGQPQWTWDGTSWVMNGGASGPVIYISDTPPPSVADGALWWESDSGILFLRYRDVDSVAWVQAAPSAADYAALQAYADGAGFGANDNLLINGFMDVSQFNGTGIAVVTANASKYFIDQWLLEVSSVAAFQVNAAQVSAAFAGINNAIIAASASSFPMSGANDYLILSTVVEGTRWSKLGWGIAGGSLPVSIGFWALSTVGGVITVSVRNQPVTRSYCAPVTLPVNQWAYRTVTIPPCPDGTWAIDNTIGARVGFTFAAGPGALYAPSANAWASGNLIAAPTQTNHVGAAGRNCYITGVTVVPGAAAVSLAKCPSMRRSFAEELTLCQRYYWKTFPLNVVPAQAWGRSGAWYMADLGAGATYGTQVEVPFPVSMRTTPTMVSYSTDSANATVRNYGLNADVGAPNFNQFVSTTERAATFFFVGASGSLGSGAGVHLTADARL